VSYTPARIRVARFGVFEADFAAGEVRKAGIKIKLHDQPLQILAMLLARPGEVITREEIKSNLWPGDTFVDFDHGLNNAVNRLRDALGDSADSPRWIETLPKRGYRFIGPSASPDSANVAAVSEAQHPNGDSKGPTTPVAIGSLKEAVRRKSGRWLFAAASMACAVAAILIAIGLRETSGPPSSRSFVLPADGTTLNLVGDDGGSVTLSPDGTKLAFVAVNSKAMAQIWIRPLGKLAAEPVPGTQGATFPFWSPDGRYLGFFADGKLKKISLEDGSIVSLADAPFGRGGSWNRHGLIVYAPGSHTGIYKVADSGGQPVAVTRVDTSIHTTHRWPKFLPDGRHFIYLAANHFADTSHNGIYRDSLTGDANTLVIHSDADATYASGYLFFMNRNALMAQAFDPDRGELRGEPRPTVERVEFDPSIWKAVFDASENGVMAYELGNTVTGTQLSWFNRKGEKVADVGEPRFQFEPRLSPDGRRLAVGIGDGGYSHIYIYDLVQGKPLQVTFGKYDNGSATWFPDGAHLLIGAKRQYYGIYKIDSRGATSEQLLLDTGRDTWPVDLSPDGRFLLFGQGVTIGRTESQFWVYPMAGNRQPYRLLDGQARELDAQFSPDGRWIAYSSDQSGRDEVYVIPFRAQTDLRQSLAASRQATVQISHSGGHRPRWRRDGRELFYLASDNTMMAVAVGTTSKFQAGDVRPLFQADPGFAIYAWDVSPDGGKFIIEAAPREKSAPITLVQNWPSDFRK
jgi:Tol biopolymer transport system component/DNA-binding winged helix-turn-helix (wHTH) protein